MASKATEGPGLSGPIRKSGGRTWLGCGARAGGRAGVLDMGAGTRPRPSAGTIHRRGVGKRLGGEAQRLPLPSS